VIFPPVLSYYSLRRIPEFCAQEVPIKYITGIEVGSSKNEVKLLLLCFGGQLPVS